jgi:catechol 2,3-dioxygenase-like lactoylglutathione lyase family enzyme
MAFDFNPLVPEIYVSDYRRSLHFYCDVLGFEVAYTRTNPLFAYLTYHSSQLMIQQQEETDQHTGPLEHPYGRGVNLQIGTPDIEKLVDSLRREGYPLRKAVDDYWRRMGGGQLVGTREFQVLDPDGYYLRFAQELGFQPNTE